MSKGGSTTSEVKVPEYIEAAAQRNLNRADRVSQLGHVREYGPTIAALTPMQEAAAQNVASTANAFGVYSPVSQSDIMGGMDAPTTYAGGVRGYSSAPLYEQMVGELERNRPGQKSYIDSFSIDPMSGDYASQPPVDYTQYNTMAEDARSETSANRANELANAPETYNTSTTSMNTPMSYLRGGVNDPFLASAPSQAIASMSTPSGMTRSSDGGYTRSGSAAPTSSPRPVARPVQGEDLPGNVLSRTLNVGAGKKDSSSDSGYSGKSGDGCVVATHAVESGAFTPHMKREAVVWCMDVLHGKWWGEAVRRGYRHCGNKKIAQGKAREHYGEFRRYIDFASGKKRTLRGALTFTLRTVQFFAVGLVKRDA